MKYGNISNYIEVEPAIPTYFVYANFMVARIVKQLLSVNPNEPDKLIIQGSWSSCFMEDDDPDDCNLSFSTLPLHPDTMQDLAAASVLEELNDDKKEAEEELARVRTTAMEGSFGTQKEHYGLKRINDRIKKTEILIIFFSIHTANAVQLARRIAKAELCQAA